jgi:uncharacterized protein with FMN-binding domain
MAMTKKILIVTVVIAAISLVLAACFVEYDPDDVPQHEAWQDSNGEKISGEKAATSYGYGPITVTVRVTNGYIDKVIIDGPADANSLGRDIIRQAPDLVKKANSFDIDALASVSPATSTKKAIREAGEQALAEITGD